MKKFIIINLLALLSLNLFSQEKGTNEIGVGAGIFTSNDLLFATETIVLDIAGMGTMEYKNQKSGPAIYLNYKKAIKNNWFFYADGAYQTIKEELYSDNLKIGDISNTFLTVGFGTEYHYVHAEWFQMYSGLSIAYSSESEKYTGATSGIDDASRSFFNFHVNAVGLRLGKALGANLELGVGYKGIVNLGVNYQF